VDVFLTHDFKQVLPRPLLLGNLSQEPGGVDVQVVDHEVLRRVFRLPLLSKILVVLESSGVDVGFREEVGGHSVAPSSLFKFFELLDLASHYFLLFFELLDLIAQGVVHDREAAGL